MNEVQKKLLNMLKWFHAFCEQNNLKYFALGGTMLGAVRHKGFIPWDDDLDVGLPRKDYEKLQELMGENLFDGKFVLEAPLKNKDFKYPFCKIYDTTTTLVENTKVKIKRGIYIDVFPLDGIGNSKEEAHKNFKKIRKLDTLLLLKSTGFRKDRKLYKNIGVALFRLIPFDTEKILKKLVAKCSLYPYDECLYCGNLVGAWREKEIMFRSIMGEPKLYDFEGIKICGAENADEYLTCLYGDWKELPPEDKRVSHHDFVEIDLNKSYIEE